MGQPLAVVVQLAIVLKAAASLPLAVVVSSSGAYSRQVRGPARQQMAATSLRTRDDAGERQQR